jgi:hypothetical protein
LKQWIKNGFPGPVMAKVRVRCIKHMVLMFFVKKRIVYMHIIPMGIAISANYIMVALGCFMKLLKEKRSDGEGRLVSQLGYRPPSTLARHPNIMKNFQTFAKFLFKIER